MPPTKAVISPRLRMTLYFWWLDPSTAPVKSSSTFACSGASGASGAPAGRQERSSSARPTFARKSPTNELGTDEASTRAASSTRTVTPCAAAHASRSPSGRYCGSAGEWPSRSSAGSKLNPAISTASPGSSPSSWTLSSWKYASPSTSGRHSLSPSKVGQSGVGAGKYSSTLHHLAMGAPDVPASPTSGWTKLVS